MGVTPETSCAPSDTVRITMRVSGFMSRNRAEQQDISQGFFNRVDLALEGLVVRGDGLYRGMPNSAIPRTEATRHD